MATVDLDVMDVVAGQDNWLLAAGADKVSAVTVPDDELISYIRSGTVSGTIQRFTVNPFLWLKYGEPVSNVRVTARCQRGGSQNAGFIVSVVVGGVVLDATAATATSTMTTFTFDFATRPGGGAWTFSDLRGGLSLQIRNTQGREVRCTTLFPTVTYTPEALLPDIHVYITPMVGDGLTAIRRPKYADYAGAQRWWAMDFGFEPLCVFAAQVTQTQDDLLSADVDVEALPVDLTQNLSAGAVTIIQTFLENHNLPGDWVDTSYTYKTMLRIVAAVFQFMQRFHGIHGNLNLFGGGVTLNTTWSQIPVGVQTDLQATADSFGYDYSWVTGSTTVRQLLKSMAQQWPGGKFIYFGSLTL